ncbi:recombinase family protein [Eubacteriales bacterium OttesenSCG-928-A19]|nr:recombinase family protein [Eubacteriales bacterium OttesenSCG-928-A19]
MIERFAKSRGLSPCIAYMDNGYSGLSEDRPAFQRMNADIASGKIGTVLMIGMSRIGRQVDKVFAWLRQVDQYNVQVIFSEEEGA